MSSPLCLYCETGQPEFVAMTTATSDESDMYESTQMNWTHSLWQGEVKNKVSDSLWTIQMSIMGAGTA